jgi:hypothetical protein
MTPLTGWDVLNLALLAVGASAALAGVVLALRECRR